MLCEETIQDLGWQGRDVTWTEKMQALVDGAIDYDDWEEIASPCAEMADLAVEASREVAKAEGKMNLAPTWSNVVPGLLRSFSQVARTTDNPRESTAAKWLLRCAEVADTFRLSES